MPVAAHSSSSSPNSRAYPTIAASTPSTCLRRESDSVHSQKSRQASSRDTSMAPKLTEGDILPGRTIAAMAFGTLAPPPTRSDWAASRMEKFVIEGGYPLSGTIVPAGNKNAALPALAAALLTEEEVVLRNIPRIRDVEAMLDLMRGIGVAVDWHDDNVVHLCAADARPDGLDPDLCNRIRASFLLAGPLLARFGRADMPPPGGDVIGRRRLDPHLDAFRALGARIERHDHTVLQLAGTLRAGEVFMDEPSVMGTENALLAAALTPGETQIFNAASEPHVVDLARMLVKMGADIRGIGSNVLHVTGADTLGGTTHDIGPDHIEIGSFMAMAGMTGGEIRIKDTEPDDLRMIRLVFRRIGLETQLDGADVIVPGGQRLVVERDMGEHTSKVQDGPWPAFPADLTSIAVALATQ